MMILETARMTLKETTARKNLSGEKVEASGGWYELLAEDLVEEDEEVECPEYGKGCSGRRGIKAHPEQSECGDATESFAAAFFISRREIEEKIALELYGDEGKWRTVRNIVSVSSLPKEAMALIKTDDELTDNER